MNKIPEKINAFNCYSNGELLATGDEFTLPAATSKTTEISGAGILGSYNSSTPGQFSTMEVEIPFKTISEDYYKLIASLENGYDLTLRGSIGRRDASTGIKETIGCRIVMRGDITEQNPGKFKPGETMDASIKMSLTYILIELEGKSMFELDRLNSVYKLNGKDMLETINKQS